MATAKSGIPGVSSNVRMRLQKWVGRATVPGKQKIERDEQIYVEPTTNASHGSRSSGIAISTKSSKPIPVSTKVGKHFSSGGNYTSASYPTSIIHSEAEESSTTYYKGDIPSSMNPRGARNLYGSTGNLTSVHLDRELGKTSKRRNRQWPRFMSKEGSSKKHKARSTDDLSSGDAQTDTNHNKRAAFQANKLKRTRQTSNDSSENLTSDSDRLSSSFATSLEEPDEEEDSSRAVEKLSEQINARLQQWVNLAEGKRERRHSEDSSASSSDCPDGSPATEIRELESALKDLVGNATYNVRARRLSRCDVLAECTNSANPESYTAPDISLLGRTLLPASETTDAGSLIQTKQAEKRPQGNALPGKQESESSNTIRDQETSGDEYVKTEVTKDSCERHARRGRVSSSDSGLSLEMEISTGKKQRYSEKSLSPQTSNCSDGGKSSGLRDIIDTVTSDKHSDLRSGNLVVAREPQEMGTCKPPDVSGRGKETNAQPSSPSGGSKVRFEIERELDPKTGYQSSGQHSNTSEMQSTLENANNRPPVVSGPGEMETSSKGNGPRKPCIMKRFSAPNLVTYGLKLRTDVRESMRHFLNFNDTGLSEFAVECVRHANRKKQRIRKTNSAGLEESCSGESDDNANDKTAAATSSAGEPDAGPKGLNNLSQNATSVGESKLASLSEEPAINPGEREFSKTAEEAEKILATASGMCSLESALPRSTSGSLRSQAGLPSRLYKFPSLPMFYCPDGTNEEAEKRQQTRSDRPLAMYADNPKLKKCRSTTNLYHQEGDLNAANASRGKNRGRLSLPVSNILDPFFHGNNPRTDKSGDKTGKQKRAGRRLKPRTWFGKLKDENDNIQKSEKKLALLLKSKSKEHSSSVNVSMEALI